MNILAQLDPTVISFLVGMGAALLTVAGFFLKKSPAVDVQLSPCTSREDYNRLIEKASNSWSLVSKNNRIYLGALMVSFAIQKFGQFSGHNLFGNPFVIAMTYLIAFASCLKNLIKGRLLDDQIISCAIIGMKTEKDHPDWGIDYFQKFINNYRYAGFAIPSLALFRVIIPSCLILSAIDFSIIDHFSDNLPQWMSALGSAAVFGLSSLLLWRIGCQSFSMLRIRSKAILA